jgi:hypothetical protein
MIMLLFSNSSKNTPTVSSSLSIHDLPLIPKAMTQSAKSYHFLNTQATVCYLILASHKHQSEMKKIPQSKIKKETMVYRKKDSMQGRKS